MRRRRKSQRAERLRGSKQIDNAALEMQSVAATPDVRVATRLEPSAIDAQHRVGSTRRAPEFRAGAMHDAA
jgi:hypothetical protein